jgi:hypothetical protein
MPGLLNASLDGNKVTVWCLPLKSMHEQYLGRCADHQMTCETWSYVTSVTNPPRNILATIEEFEKEVFHEFMTRLVDLCLLARLIVDEAHLAVTHQEFREVMGTLAWVGAMGVQIILMSASMGPSLEGLLFKKFGIRHYVVCREQTCRANICYSVTVARDIDAELQRLFGQIGEEKSVIYCRSKETARATAERLRIPHCDGLTNRTDTNAILKSLRTGAVKAIACTTVLGVALDVPDIKYIFHLDYPYDMISYIQESGRCGRSDGSMGYSTVIIPQWTSIRIPKLDLFGAQLIHDWAKDRTHCRRWLMQLFNDGVAEPCSMMRGVVNMCDVCRQDSRTIPERGEEQKCTVDMINPYVPAEHSQ